MMEFDVLIRDIDPRGFLDSTMQGIADRLYNEHRKLEEKVLKDFMDAIVKIHPDHEFNAASIESQTQPDGTAIWRDAVTGAMVILISGQEVTSDAIRVRIDYRIDLSDLTSEFAEFNASLAV